MRLEKRESVKTNLRENRDNLRDGNHKNGREKFFWELSKKWRGGHGDVENKKNLLFRTFKTQKKRIKTENSIFDKKVVAEWLR